jgi:5-methylcytosine-specific restriction endonuclease McrA
MAWGNGNRPKRNSTVRAQHRRRCPPRFCAQCGRGGPGVRLIQDHVVPLSQGGLDVIANYQWICADPCHAAKTRREAAAGRARAKAARGSLSKRYRDLEQHPGALGRVPGDPGGQTAPMSR